MLGLGFFVDTLWFLMGPAKPNLQKAFSSYAAVAVFKADFRLFLF